MDTRISKEKIRKKKQKRLLQLGLVLIVLMLIIIFIRMMLKPTVDREEFSVATAERGFIAASVPATGLVLPEFEEVINSPAQTRIIKAFLPVGSALEPGDTILSLDVENARLKMRQLSDELEMKKNNITKQEIQLEKELIDLQTEEAIKKLQVDNTMARLKQEEYLFEIGGGTREKVKQAQLELEVAKIEQEQIRKTVANRQKSMKANMQGLRLEVNIQQNQLNELQATIDRSTIIAAKKGVLTFLEDQAGQSVSKGQMLVKIADLGSYIVQSRISEANANKLRIGGDVQIRLDKEHEFKGRVQSISPTVESNSISFVVAFEKQDLQLLRPRLNVDVFVMTTSKENALLIRNGSFYRGRKKQDIFLFEADKLIRKKAEFGLQNADFVEIISGAKEGDKIVTTKLNKLEGYDEISVD